MVAGEPFHPRQVGQGPRLLPAARTDAHVGFSLSSFLLPSHCCSSSMRSQLGSMSSFLWGVQGMKAEQAPKVAALYPTVLHQVMPPGLPGFLCTQELVHGQQQLQPHHSHARECHGSLFIHQHPSAARGVSAKVAMCRSPTLPTKMLCTPLKLWRAPSYRSFKPFTLGWACTNEPPALHWSSSCSFRAAVASSSVLEGPVKAHAISRASCTKRYSAVSACVSCLATCPRALQPTCIGLPPPRLSASAH